jgi:hypothetical protein
MADELQSSIKNAVYRLFRESDVSEYKFDKLVDFIRDNLELKNLRDSDVSSVIQPMIVTGKLKYTPGLNIGKGINLK